MLKSSRLWACFRNGRCTTRRTVITAVIAAVPSSRIEYRTQLFRYQILIWPITKEQSSVVHVLHWHNARCVALRRILEVVVTFWPKWPWKSLSRSSRPVLRRTLNKSWHQLLSDLCSVHARLLVAAHVLQRHVNDFWEILSCFAYWCKRGDRDF